MRNRPRAWLELIRPPNVATALADVLAGYAIAGLPADHRLLLLLAATAGLYAGGIVLNDFFDREIDATERPERPIPSGRVTPAQAGGFGVVLLAGGIGAAAAVGHAPALIAAGVAGCAVAYDAWTKHYRVVGPINMGMCRGLNLILGMSASPVAIAAHWPLALINLTYISGVTLASQGEVHGGRRGSAIAATWLVGIAALAAAVPSIRGRDTSAAGIALAALLAGRTLPAFLRAWRDGSAANVRRAVRTGVLSLVFLDAALAAAYAGMIYAVGIIVISLAAGRLARAFAVT